MTKIEEALSFDDVLLVPLYSDLQSRKEVDFSFKLKRLNDITFTLPIISSPMDTVTETNMAIAMFAAGGLGIIHRYNTIEKQTEMVTECVQSKCEVGAAIGVKDDYLTRAARLVNAGARVICIDIAHGDHILAVNAARSVRKLFPNIHIMAGNVATLDGFNLLAGSGADSIRVGIGGGAICSTRIQTGHGVPTFQSILECSKTDRDAMIIADGGIKTSGDIVKAYAAGADLVMLGSMLAATSDTPGDLIPIYASVGSDPTYYKSYRGMASPEAQRAWRGYTSSDEGISTQIPFKGETKSIISQIQNRIESGLSYSGARTIQELQYKRKFVRQSSAGINESSTHIEKIK